MVLRWNQKLFLLLVLACSNSLSAKGEASRCEYFVGVERFELKADFEYDYWGGDNDISIGVMAYLIKERALEPGTFDAIRRDRLHDLVFRYQVPDTGLNVSQNPSEKQMNLYQIPKSFTVVKMNTQELVVGLKFWAIEEDPEVSEVLMGFKSDDGDLHNNNLINAFEDFKDDGFILELNDNLFKPIGSLFRESSDELPVKFKLMNFRNSGVTGKVDRYSGEIQDRSHFWSDVGVTNWDSISVSRKTIENTSIRISTIIYRACLD